MRRRIARLALLLTLSLSIPVEAVGLATSAPGELDPSFDGDGWAVTDVDDWGRQSAELLQPDGKIVVAGKFRNQFQVWRFHGTGQLDTSFAGTGRVLVDLPGRGGGGLAAALQPDGKIVVVGYSGFSLAAVRFLPEGALDPGFGEGDGTVMVRIPRMRATAEAVELLPDGRILLGSQLVRFRRGRKAEERPAGLALTLLSPAGALDPTFGSGGIRRAPGLFADLTLDDQGIVVMGVDRKRPARITVARYTFGGISDETFAPGGRVERSFGKRVEVYDGEVLIDAGGRFVVSITGVSRRCFFGYGAVARLNADGGWDPTFSGDGVAARGCRSWPQLGIQQDGKIVAAGEIFGGAGSGEYIPVMARLGADGGLDLSFGSEGIVTSMPPDPTPRDDAGGLYFAATEDVVLQPDGKIVLLAQAIWEYSFALGRFLAT